MGGKPDSGDVSAASTKLLKTLREEAARQGFRVRIENEEIQFEGAGDSSMLCQIAADLSGAVRRVRKEEEERLQWFRARVLEQIGSGLSDPLYWPAASRGNIMIRRRVFGIRWRMEDYVQVS